MPQDSEEYLAKKKFFNKILTIYGRKPALEAMHGNGVKVHRLHLADSNKPAKILDDIIGLAERSGAEIVYHSRQALSRISKNSKQDQGVAVDLLLQGFDTFEDLNLDNLATQNQSYIALDNVTNPQNLGMIIRSVCASPMAGLIIPQQGCAKLDSLVIKASAGTLFKARIIRSNSLVDSLRKMREAQFNIVGLDLAAKQTISDYESNQNSVFVLGNESEGISKEIQKTCSHTIKIPMANDVESLNVAVTASLIAFKGAL